MKAKLAQPKTEWRTYIARAVEANKVKIGKSRRVEKRIADLNMVSPYQIDLLFTTEEEEYVLHDKFASFRIKGEWFREEGELALWITEKLAQTAQNVDIGCHGALQPQAQENAPNSGGAP